MKEGSAHRAMTNPFSAPHATPVSPASTIAAASGSRQSASATPSTAPDRASTEPTDRSIPPVMTTSVMPVATRSTSGSWFAMVRTVVAVRKCSVAAPNPMTSAASTPRSAAYSESCRPSAPARVETSTVSGASPA